MFSPRFSPRNAQIIVTLLTSSLLLGIPGSAVKPLRAQTSAGKSQAKPTEAAKPKPDYSQESAVVEQLSTAYRFASVPVHRPVECAPAKSAYISPLTSFSTRFILTSPSSG